MWVVGSQRVVKGNKPLFQLLLRVILLQVANEIVLGR